MIGTIIVMIARNTYDVKQKLMNLTKRGKGVKDCI